MRKNLLLLLCLMSFAFAAQSQERITLIETFTSSTCGPCNFGNVHLQELLTNGQNDNKYVSLKYQMSWPGQGDPYYTEEGGVRRNLYGIGGIPNSIIDGQTQIGTGSLDQPVLDNAYAIAPKATITTTYYVDVDNQMINVSVDVEALVDIEAGKKLFIAVFEHQTTANVGSNGETEFENVMKKMLPDANGSSMPALSAGEHFYYDETYTFQGDYRLPNSSLDLIDHTIENSVEDFTDLGVATWIQSEGTDFTINAPEEVAGSYAVALADFGSAIPTTALSEDLVIFNDATGDPYDACEDAVNAEEMDGKIVVIRRGSCEFGCKVELAQNAGAVAVIVVNNVAGEPIPMGGGVCGVNVTIPSIMINMADGEALISEIEGGATVNSTLVDRGLEIFQAGYGDMVSNVAETIIESSVKIYPNPANTTATVALRLSENQDVTIDILNVMGQVVYSTVEKNVAEGRSYHTINTSLLTNGIYTLRLSTGTNAVTKNLVIKN